MPSFKDTDYPLVFSSSCQRSSLACDTCPTSSGSVGFNCFILLVLRPEHRPLEIRERSLSRCVDQAACLSALNLAVNAVSLCLQLLTFWRAGLILVRHRLFITLCDVIDASEINSIVTSAGPDLNLILPELFIKRQPCDKIQRPTIWFRCRPFFPWNLSLCRKVFASSVITSFLIISILLLAVCWSKNNQQQTGAASIEPQLDTNL